MNHFVTGLLVVLLPLVGGAGVSRILLNRIVPASIFVSAAFAYAIGLCLWSWTVWIGYTLQLPLQVVGVAFLAQAAVCFVVAHRAAGHGRRLRLSRDDLILLAVLLALFVFQYHVGTYQDLAADTTRHLGYIQRALGLAVLTPEIYELSADVSVGLLSGNYSYNSVYPLYAYASMLTGAEPTGVFLRASAFMLMIAVCAYAAATQAIFPEQRYVYPFLVFVLLIWAFVTSPSRTFAYPNMFGYVAYVMFVTFAFLARRGQLDSIRLFAAAALLSSTLSIHPQWWLYSLITAGIFVAFALLTRDSELFKRTAMMLTGFLLFSAPLVYVKWSAYSAIKDQLIDSLAGFYVDRIYTLGDWIGIYPLRIFTWLDMLVVSVAFAVLLELFVNQRKKPRGRVNSVHVVAFNIVAIAMVILIPPLTTLMSEFATLNFVFRLSTYLLMYWWTPLLLTFVAAWTFSRAMDAARGYEPWSRLQSRLAPHFGTLAALLGLGFAASILLLPGSQMNAGNWRESDANYGRIYGPTIEQTLASPELQQMLAEISHDAVVLSDTESLVVQNTGAQVNGAVQRHSLQEKSAAARIDALFDYATPVGTVVSEIERLAPNYVLLSPKHSNLSWMRFDTMDPRLIKVADVVADSIDYFNNRFVLYRWNGVSSAGGENAPRLLPEFEPGRLAHCTARRLAAGYRSDIAPAGWNIDGDELGDGEWSTTDHALLWSLLRKGWFYIEFDLHEEANVERVIVRNNHFTSSYDIQEISVFASTDGQFWTQLDHLRMEEQMSAGMHEWTMDGKGARASSLRLAVNGVGNVTLGEVEIFGRGVDENCAQ